MRIFILLFCFYCFPAIGQTTIDCSVISRETNSPEASVFVSLFYKDSLLSQNITDLNGKVLFTAILDSTKAYSIHIEKDGFYNNNPAAEFLGREETIYLEIALLKVFRMALPHLPVFDLNETIKYSQFEQLYFVDLLKEYKNIELDVFYAPRKSEKRNLMRKRTKIFKQELRKLNVDMNRVHFSKDQPDWHVGCEGCFYSTVSSWGDSD